MIKWIEKPQGNCPIFATGLFLGYFFYFKARGRYAFIEFSKDESDWIENKTEADYILQEFEKEVAHALKLWSCRLLIWKGCWKFLTKQTLNRLCSYNGNT